MSRSLCIKPSGLPEVKNRPWRLVLRNHDLGGTDYETVALLDDETAREVVEAGRVSWLYTPDWDERYRLRALERARVMREEAEKIETAAMLRKDPESLRGSSASAMIGKDAG